MDYKLRLKVGLFLTALVTALLLSDLMPPLFGAAAFLLVGLSLSYFIAADYIKERKIRDMALMIKGLEDIGRASGKSDYLKLLLIWAERLIPGAEYYLWIKGEEAEGKWQDLLTACADEPQAKFIEDKSLLPAEFTAGLFMPLTVKGNIQAVLICAGSDVNLKPVQIKLMGPLLNIAESIGEKNGEEEDKKVFIKGLLAAVIRVMETFNPAMAGHASRVAEISLIMGERLGLNENELRDLEYGALLHDIGQTAVLYQGLNSADEGVKGDYTDHPVLGAGLLPDTEKYQGIKEAVLYHHEHYDGSGYPEGLAYTDIPLNARIIAIADIYDTLTNLANEDERLSQEAAWSFIKRGAGSYFDPLAVAAWEEVRL